VHAVDHQRDPVVLSRVRFTSRTSWEIAAIGSRTPVLECTHVTPTTRVSGRISAAAARSHSRWKSLTALVQGNAPHRRAGARGRQPRALVMDEVIVGGEQQLVAACSGGRDRRCRDPSWLLLVIAT
jgi:hypothetical protein